ncbi:MAG TPA: glucose-6-phosphate dehydrogenase [Candidatus Saccharimonadales bacterium]|nr:glucose-6-phosphate dehydrogenase [Candidatus Saccharimonadales bacterium]
MEETAKLPATILVIFGITGDLSHRFLLPALAQVCSTSNLPKDFKVLGVSRRDVNVDELLRDNEKPLQKFTKIFQMNLNDPQDYKDLEARLTEMTQEMTISPQIIFYFAVPPAAVLPIIRHLGQAGLNGPETKLLLEKPFGFDLESARELIAQTTQYFPEEQIYRIDHYLAKEMAQNITVFLGSNAIFRDVWNSQFVEKIEIVAAEKIGIEGRAAFYESTGALRDVVQSHLLQLAALTLMEPCSEIFDFEEIPRRRLAALRQLQPPPPDKFDDFVFRAQYEGYSDEVGNPGSQVETFVNLVLSSTDARWQGVPIHLTTGKNLDQKLTEIKVTFKKTSASAANHLLIRIQPEESIELDLWVKAPGYDRKLQKLPLSFEYQQHFGRLPDAYEQVLVDAMSSNHALFASSDEVLASWSALEPILKHWGMHEDLYFYKPGSMVDEVLSVKSDQNQL